jgi:hypothetical protein
VKNYWVDRRQVIGFIGSLFIIFSIFLPFYEINLFSAGTLGIPLVDIPFVGTTLALVLVVMGILAIVALAFEEYQFLYMPGFVSLTLAILMFVFTELGFIIIADNLPAIVSHVINYLIGYDFGWIVLLAGSGFLLVIPRL